MQSTPENLLCSARRRAEMPVSHPESRARMGAPPHPFALWLNGETVLKSVGENANRLVSRLATGNRHITGTLLPPAHLGTKAHMQPQNPTACARTAGTPQMVIDVLDFVEATWLKP